MYVEVSRLFEENLSAEVYYPPRNQQAGKGFKYFIIIQILHMYIMVPAYFLDIFVFLGTKLSNSFFFISDWPLQNVFFWFSLPNEKLSLNVCLFLGFPSVKVKSNDGY